MLQETLQQSQQIPYLRTEIRSPIDTLVIKLDAIFTLPHADERTSQIDEIKEEVSKVIASENTSVKERILIETLFLFCQAKKHNDRTQNKIDVLGLLVRQTDISRVHALTIILNPHTSDEIVAWSKKLLTIRDMKEIFSFNDDASNLYEFLKDDVVSNLLNPDISEIKFLFSVYFGLMSEHKERHSLLLSHIHPSWHRSLQLTKLLFHEELNSSDQVSACNEETLQRLIGITAQSLSEFEDPRRSYLVKEVIASPNHQDELGFILTAMDTFQASSGLEYSWVVDGIKELIPSLRKYRELTSDVANLLFSSQHPDALSCLKEIQKMSSQRSDAWLISTVALAARGDQKSLRVLDKGLIRKPIVSRVDISNEKIEKIISTGIDFDSTGALTRLLWEQITTNKIFSRQVIADIGMKTIDAKPVVTKEEIQQHCNNLLIEYSAESLEKFEQVENIIGLAKDLSLILRDDLLALTSQRYNNPYFDAVILYRYLLQNFEHDFPLCFQLISGVILPEDLELLLKAKQQQIPIDKLHHCLYASDHEIMINFDLFAKFPKRFPEIFIKMILSNNYPNQSKLLTFYEDAQWRRDFLDVLSDASDLLTQNDTLDASQKIKIYLQALLDAERLGITKPFRLLPSQLIDIVRARQSPQHESTAPSIAIFSSRSDYNNAFQSIADIISNYQDAGYLVIYYEITDKYHLAEMIEEFRNEFKTAATIWIAAHASGSKMQYAGNNHSLNLNNSDIQFLRQLGIDSIIETNGQLVLQGCSTNQTLQGSVSIAGGFEYLLANRPDVDIASSRFITSAFDLSYQVGDDGLLRVKYPDLPVHWNIG
jgi:hypothetical protein